MHYVYLLRSEAHENQKYVGVTTDMDRRLDEHNAGLSKHTVKYMPWKLVAYFGFSDKYKAFDFERYLKSHSGRAFAQKRFW